MDTPPQASRIPSRRPAADQPFREPESQPLSPASTLPPGRSASQSGSSSAQTIGRSSNHSNTSNLINFSRNTSMTSMHNSSTGSGHRVGTPVSNGRLPHTPRHELVEGTASYGLSDSGPAPSSVHSAVNPRAYLPAAPRRTTLTAPDVSLVPTPLFDSFISDVDRAQADLAGHEAGDAHGGPAVAAHTPTAETPSVSAENLRSSLPLLPATDAGPIKPAAVLNDPTLPLHVRVDLARSLRRPTAIAKLGEWTPYEAAPAESYLYKPPVRFFQLRWALMRFNPLTWNCSGQPYTVGEALMTFAIVGQMIVTGFWWAIDPEFRVNVSVTGTMAVFILMLTFFMAIHSNVIALLFLGLPFDRQLPWHKLLAVSTCFHTVIHLIAFYAGGRSDTVPDAEEAYHFPLLWERRGYGMEVSGWLLSVPIFAMTFMGWSYISRRCFAYFYKVHVISAAATIIGVLLHGFGAAITNGIMPLALPGGAFWLLDLGLRATFGSALTKASQTKLRLIPARSLSSAPVVSIEVPHSRDRRFTAGQWVFVCLPALGVLHWHPFTIASSSNDSDMRVAIACKGKWTGKLAELAAKEQTAKVYVEGPYGSPMIDVHGPRYKCFVVVAGGIGWTFLRSWRRQLLQDACRGRPVKAVSTITVLRAADQHHAAEILDSPAIDGPLVLPSELELQDTVFLTGVPKRSTVGFDGVGREFEPVSLPGVNTTCGRPDFFVLLSDAADIAKALGETRVAVLVCGSLGIVHSIQDDIPKIPTDVSIDLHYEVLAF